MLNREQVLRLLLVGALQVATGAQGQPAAEDGDRIWIESEGRGRGTKKRGWMLNRDGSAEAGAGIFPRLC